MKGVKDGFLKVGESYFIREESIVAVIFKDDVDYSSDGGHQEPGVEIRIQGADPIDLSTAEDIAQMREWVKRAKTALVSKGKGD